MFVCKYVCTYVMLHAMAIKGQATNQKALSVILLCIAVAATEDEASTDEECL